MIDPAKSGITRAVLQLWWRLTKRRRFQIAALLGFSLVASFLEVLSLGMLFPLLALIAAPMQGDSNRLVDALVSFSGVRDSQALVGLVLLSFCIAALVAGGVRLAVLWATNRLSFAVSSELAERVYCRALFEPYVQHLLRNSSSMIDLTVNKTSSVANQVISSVLVLITSTIMGIGILGAIMATNPLVAASTAALFGLMYLGISGFARVHLRRNSEIIASHSVRAIRTIQEGLGGIRDVIIDGTQEKYIETFRRADRPLKAAHARNAVIGGAPRFVVETIGMILIALLAFMLSRSDGGIAEALPTLGVLALGAQRLLPLLQQGYSSLANIRGSEMALWEVLDYLDTPSSLPAPGGRMPFKRELRLDQVSFDYPGSDTKVLKKIDLVIPRGARVGLFGHTGSGKSTTLDIIMGLLTPSAGRLLVDGVSVTPHNQAQWRRNIAHVPQAIFLSDATIAENIAFGVADNEVDLVRVEQAARRAQLHDTIAAWPQGYRTMVGERGVRLSGGQRQRIGIARALYKRAELIILDEATSALDNETEAALIEGIEAIGTDITILMVAHRLTTLRNCGLIIELQAGQVKRTGSYAELIGQ